MRRIKQLLTMRFGAGASTRQIARELGVAPRMDAPFLMSSSFAMSTIRPRGRAQRPHNRQSQ